MITCIQFRQNKAKVQISKINIIHLALDWRSEIAVRRRKSTKNIPQ